MQQLSKMVVVVLICLMIGPASPRAAADQGSLVSESEIQRAVEKSLADEEVARESIRSLLRRADVRELAADVGLDSGTLELAVSAVDTLDGEELEQVSAHAADLDDQLAGGVTVTISLVALLLIIIIIILLAK